MSPPNRAHRDGLHTEMCDSREFNCCIDQQADLRQGTHSDLSKTHMAEWRPSSWWASGSRVWGHHTCKRLLRGRGLAPGSSAAGSISEAVGEVGGAAPGGRAPLGAAWRWDACSEDLEAKKSPVVPLLTGRGEMGEVGSPDMDLDMDATLE